MFKYTPMGLLTIIGSILAWRNDEIRTEVERMRMRSKNLRTERNDRSGRMLKGIVVFMTLAVFTTTAIIMEDSCIVQGNPDVESRGTECHTSTFRISPLNATEVGFSSTVETIDDSKDEIRTINITFLDIENGSENYTFSITRGALNTSRDARNLGFPGHTKFLKGYYCIGLEEGFPAFIATVSIDFHISQRSQLGTKTSEILYSLKLMRRTMGNNSWEELGLSAERLETVNETDGLYRITMGVNEFGDFAILLAQPDLIVKEVRPGADPTYSGQTMRITVVVHNGGGLTERTAENVKVKLFSIDADGNQEFIGELDYGTIDPGTDYSPNDTGLGEGDKQATLLWTTSTLLTSGEIQTFTINAQVDPDGYVRESNDYNNERNEDVEVVGVSGGCYGHYVSYDHRPESFCFAVALSLLSLPVTYSVIWRYVK